MVDNTDDGLGARIGPLAEAGRSALAGGSTNRTVRNDPDEEHRDRHKVRSGGYPQFG
jgi:hypothetical protein